MSKSRDLGEFPAAALDIDASGNLDVDGTVTAAGIELEANAINLEFMETGVADLNTRLRQNSGDFIIQTLDDAKTAVKSRLNINHATGDISFYEDTGTTTKFFWDSSAENLSLDGGADPLTISRNGGTCLLYTSPSPRDS